MLLLHSNRQSTETRLRKPYQIPVFIHFNPNRNPCILYLHGLIVRKDINFSVKEFDVLYMLYSNPGMAFTKQQIYEAVWHEKANGYFHAVENTIFQIRKKIKKYSSDKNYIKTVVGYGYKFEV